VASYVESITSTNRGLCTVISRGRMKNVLVGVNGVKLGDFGSAKRIVDEGENLDVDERYKVRGTPLWMAPEVLNRVLQGPASDIGLWVAL